MLNSVDRRTQPLSSVGRENGAIVVQIDQSDSPSSSPFGRSSRPLAVAFNDTRHLPVWFDPWHWYQGLVPPPNLHRQIRS